MVFKSDAFLAAMHRRVARVFNPCMRHVAKGIARLSATSHGLETRATKVARSQWSVSRYHPWQEESYESTLEFHVRDGGALVGRPRVDDRL
jgi:hypothetical protein